MANESENKIRELEDRITRVSLNQDNLASEIREISNDRRQLKYPADVQTEKTIEAVINKTLPVKIFDYFWRNVIYWCTFFESIDGYDTEFTGAGSTADVINNYMRLFCDSNGASISWVRKNVLNSEPFRWDRRSRFRSTIKIALPNSGSIAYLTTGSPNDSSTYRSYGFRINNLTLLGLATDSVGTQTTITLQTLSTSTNYELEADFVPYNSVTFYVDRVARGKITTGLPS